LLGADPDDESRRLLLRGKGNHSAAPRSFEFKIAPEVVELNEHTSEVPRVTAEVEGDRTVADRLNAAPSAPVTGPLADQLEALLTDDGQTLAALARGVGRDPKDGSVRNALTKLKKEKRAEKDETAWKRPHAHGAGPYGHCTSHPDGPGPDGGTGPDLFDEDLS